MTPEPQTSEPTKPQRLVGYARVSTKAQADDGLGLEVQAYLMGEWCRVRGIELVDVFEDRGVSGAREGLDRPGFQDVLAALRSQQEPVQGLLVAKLDRLARDFVIQENLRRELLKRGKDLYSADDGENELLRSSEDPTRNLIRQILGSISEYERAMIKFRTSSGRRARRLAGGFTGGTVGYGFRVIAGRVEPHPHEYEVIGQARTLHAMGLPLRAIGEYFAAEGIRLRKGKRWHPNTVRQILRRCEDKGDPPAMELGPLARDFADLAHLSRDVPR